MEFQIRLFRSDEIECIPGAEGCLGSGSYGTVRLAFHRIHGMIAVKCSVMRGGARKMNQLEQKIKNEIELIQKAQHENIVRVYGWTQWPSAIGIVMEYLPGGNLMEALEDDDVTIEPLLRLRICYEISNGIAFIHNFSPEKRLVHGDIKAENILLTEDFHCKLADFGGARLSAYTGGSTATNRRQHTNHFTELYASPEILENPTAKLKYSHDTYSFSVTMYVVIGRELPLLSDLQMNVYLEKVKQGHRLELEVIDDIIRDLREEDRSLDVEITTVLKEVMKECWSQEPSARPLMVDVKNGLYELLARQDPVKIQQFAVDAAKAMNVRKLSRGQYECVPLHKFSAPDFNSIGDSSSDSPRSSTNVTTNDITYASTVDVTIPTLTEGSTNIANTSSSDGADSVFLSTSASTSTTDSSSISAGNTQGTSVPVSLLENHEIENNPIKKELLQKIKGNPNGRALIEVCNAIKECADDSLTNLAAFYFPIQARIWDTPISSEDAHSLSFVLKKVTKKLEVLNLGSCDLKSDTFHIMVEAIMEMEGSIDLLYIYYNTLSTIDINGICNILDKVNDKLWLGKCFDDGNGRMRHANQEEQNKIQTELNMLENVNLTVFIAGDVLLRKQQPI